MVRERSYQADPAMLHHMSLYIDTTDFASMAVRNGSVLFSKKTTIFGNGIYCHVPYYFGCIYRLVHKVLVKDRIKCNSKPKRKHTCDLASGLALEGVARLLLTSLGPLEPPLLGL